jgi:electron transport complex protein RnfG
MTTPAAPPLVPETPTRAMLATLGLVAALCGLIIVGAYEGSLPAVQENRRVALERAIHKVLPGAGRIVGYHALRTGEVVPAKAGTTETPDGAIAFHAAYDAAGALIGIAAEGAGKGYADTVRILFGYETRCQCVVGMSVVFMRETPGIGDKVSIDPAFLANFRALDARLGGDLKALANQIKTVKHGTKTQPWQIDAIAGATITSRAIGRAINDTAQVLLPRIVPSLPNLDRIGKPL